MTYFYRLEDIETTGRTKLHGPVAATPARAQSSAGASLTEASALVTYGEPEATSLRVVERGARRMIVELRVAGFSAEPLEDGAVRLSIPGFSQSSGPGSPAIPTKQSWVEVNDGRSVRVSSVRSEGVEYFSSLRPAAAEATEMAASREGTVWARRVRGDHPPRSAKRRCTRRRPREFSASATRGRRRRLCWSWRRCAGTARAEHSGWRES